MTPQEISDVMRGLATAAYTEIEDRGRANNYAAGLRCGAEAVLLVESLQALIAELETPTHFYDVKNWDCTHDASTLSILTDEVRHDEVMEIGRLHQLPSVWAVRVPLEFSDDLEEVTEDEVQLFDTKAEAHAAACPFGPSP